MRERSSSTLLLSVADGAGSAVHASDGAVSAVQAALDSAQSALVQRLEPRDEATWNAVRGDRAEL